MTAPTTPRPQPVGTLDSRALDTEPVDTEAVGTEPDDSGHRPVPDALAKLAGRWANDRDGAAGEALLGEFMPYVNEMIRGDRADARGTEREDLEAEAAALILEYLAAGGEPIAAKVGAVVRGRLRRLRNRPVKLTDGEERVLRVALVVQADAEANGEHLSTDELRDRVEQRCWEWARERTEDDDEAHRKLVQRGVIRALKNFTGLLEAASHASLDAPTPAGTPLGELLVDERDLAADETGGHGENLVEALIGHLDAGERDAVLWMCGIGGDARTPRREIADATGVPIGRLARLLAELAGRARCSYIRWALLDPELPDAFIELAGDPVSDLLTLARP